jgi:hypothetical protein
MMAPGGRDRVCRRGADHAPNGVIVVMIMIMIAFATTITMRPHR